MTRDDPTETLISLIKRVPVYVVDKDAAAQSGDHIALAYAAHIQVWRDVATRMIAEIRQGNAACTRHAAPDAFARIAAASELLRQDQTDAA